MGRPADHPAYRRLAEEVSRLAGLRVSAREVRRWREAGALPRLRRHGMGRGKGSRVEVPAGMVDHAVHLARAIGTYPSLDEAILACFARGYDPRDHRVLLACYRRCHERLQRYLGRGDRGRSDPWAAAERISGRLVRRPPPALRRLKERAPGTDLREVLTGVLAALLGAVDHVHPEAVQTIAGLDLPRSEPVLPGLAGPTPVLPALLREVEEADPRDLGRARDLLLVAREALRVLASRSGSIGRIAGALEAVTRDDLAAALVLVPIVLLVVRTARGSGEPWAGTVREVWRAAAEVPDEAWAALRGEPDRIARPLARAVEGLVEA